MRPGRARTILWTVGLGVLGVGLCALSLWSFWVRWEGFFLGTTTDYFGYALNPAGGDTGRRFVLFLAEMAPQLAGLGLASIIGSLFLLSRPRRVQVRR